MISSGALVTVGVLVVVAAAQLWIFVRSRRTARGESEEVFASLQERFTRDIERRAGRGHPPDWLHYRAEIDRLFEPRDEALRVKAAAALAVGLGGTILALLLHLVVLPDSGGFDDPWRLIQGMGVALFGSLSGVVVHLLITLWLLPRAESDFEVAADELVGDLRQVAEEHPPVEIFTKTLKNELGAVAREFSSEAMAAFPGVIEKLVEQMGQLGEVVESQAERSEKAVDELTSCARLVSDSSERLRPTAEQMAEVSTALVEVPEQLSAALETGRHYWIEVIHEEQRQSRDRLFGQIEAMERSAADRERQLHQSLVRVGEVLENLPARLSDDLLGDLLNRVHRDVLQQVADLQTRLEEQQEDIFEKIRDHESTWYSNLGPVTEKLFEKVAAQVEAGLSEELQAVAQEIGDSTRLLATASEGFETSHESWRATQQETLTGWQEVAERIEQAAESLTVGDRRLEEAVEALDRSADHLERISSTTEEFERALREALAEVTDQHLEGLHPIHREVAEMVEQLKSTRGQFDGVVGEQSRFIRQLIEQIVERRGLRSVEET